jgi:RNA polymerase sigma factor (sigma-70 family)
MLMRPQHLLHQVQSSLNAGSAGISDGELLSRFISTNDQNSFAILLDRYAGLVMGVCRRVVGETHLAEDVFQATFVVLSQKASSLRHKVSLPAWLHRVAFRLALRARQSMRLRQPAGRPIERLSPASPLDDLSARELLAILDEEIIRLPEIQRTALILCCLEGHSQEEAAHLLGCSPGSIKGHLERGRILLRNGLSKRGFFLSAVLGSQLVLSSYSAVSAHLMGDTLSQLQPGGALKPGIAALVESFMRSSFLTKLKVIGLSILLVCGVGFCAGMIDRSVGKEPHLAATVPEAKDPEQEDKFKKGDETPGSTLTVLGKVVDEKGAPLSGIQVRLMLTRGDGKTTTTDRDGTFRLPWPVRLDTSWVPSCLVASDSDGSLQGIPAVSKKTKKLKDGEEIRVVLKPARTTTIRVLDARKQPVDAARVVMQSSSLTLLTTGETRADGTITLRSPADAEIDCVFAFKPGLGFDYFSTALAKHKPERKPLPDEVALQLVSARTVRIKAVDSDNKPVAGVAIHPWYIQLNGKLDHANMGGDVHAVNTDSSGVAAFDWIPADFDDAIAFFAYSPTYSHAERVTLEKKMPATELTMHLLRKAKLSGKVVGLDGKPAAGIVVEANGAGSGYQYGNGKALTRPDGSYEMTVNGEVAYIVTVVDNRWASASHTGIAVREGKPVSGLDFQLTDGTIVRGTLTVGKDRRPLADQYLSLSLNGGDIPSEIRKEGDNYSHEVNHNRWTTTDSEGHYRFCVGPGKYVLTGPTGMKAKEIVVAREKEVVNDLHMPRPEFGRLVVKVIDADGKPVPGATVEGQYMRGTNKLIREATTDASGTFEVERVLVPAALFARTKDGKFAGTARIDFEQEQVTIRVGPVAPAEGRLLDNEGKIVVGGRIQYGVIVTIIQEGHPNDVCTMCFGGVVITGNDGRFSLKGLTLGEEYTINFDHGVERAGWSTITTVTPTKAETIHLGDFRIPKLVPPPYQPPTLEETTTKLFAKREKLSERIARAQAEAKSHYLRVLVIVGDPTDANTRKLVGLIDSHDAIGAVMCEFEQLAVSTEDTESLAVLRKTYDLDADPRKLPTLFVLGEDGKLIAKNSPSLDGKRTEIATPLKEFLANQALPPQDAKKLLTAAQDQARREGKRVFLKESGTYCYPCRLLSRFLDKQKAILDSHYVFVEIDRGRFTHGDEVMMRYRGKEERSIPWCAILDANGKMLGHWDGPDGNIGFPSQSKSIDHFLGVLKATTPGLTSTQLTELRQALEQKR